MGFAEALQISKGITSIIGSGGKTSLMYRLAQELSRHSKVIVTTSTMIFPPTHIRVVQELTDFEGCICIGTPCPNGKLSAPLERFESLAKHADYVLVEADGSKQLPLKAHLAHEPVIVPSSHVICVVGASGLDSPIEESVHHHERFYELTGEKTATVQAVASALMQENLAHRYLINQFDTNPNAAKELAKLLSKPCVLACLQKGEIICSY